MDRDFFFSTSNPKTIKLGINSNKKGLYNVYPLGPNDEIPSKILSGSHLIITGLPDYDMDYIDDYITTKRINVKKILPINEVKTFEHLSKIGIVFTERNLKWAYENSSDPIKDYILKSGDMVNADPYSLLSLIGENDDLEGIKYVVENIRLSI